MTPNVRGNLLLQKRSKGKCAISSSKSSCEIEGTGKEKGKKKEKAKKNSMHFDLGVIKLNGLKYFILDRRILHAILQKKIKLACAVVMLLSLRFHFLI